MKKITIRKKEKIAMKRKLKKKQLKIRQFQ